MFGEEDEIIAKDRKRNPNCGYSTSIEQSCGRGTEEGSKQGEYVCNTIKKVYRQCPNQSPVLIMQKKSENSAPGLFGGLFGSLNKKGSNLDEGLVGGEFDSSFNEMRKNLEEVMGHRELKSMIDIMREAHGKQMKSFDGGNTDHDTINNTAPERSYNARSPHNEYSHQHNPHQPKQHQKLLPFHEDYDKAVDEAMAGMMVDDYPGDRNNAKRKGTASGSVRKV